MNTLRSRLAPTEVKALLKGDLNALRARCLDPDHGVVQTFEDLVSSITMLRGYSLDHIIPKSRGGKDHPHNYFLMRKEVNGYFGNSWTAEKVAYIGLEAAVAAGTFRWPGLRLKKSLLKSMLRDKATLCTR
jgi:hypothetical protein